MGLNRLLFFVFREHYRCGFTNPNANSYTQSDPYANTNRDSHANPHCNAHANSGAWDRSHQSRYFRSAGKPQLR